MAITITSQTSNKLVFRVQPLASNNATISEARVYIDDNIKQTYSVNSKDKTIEFNFNPSDYFEGTHNIKIRIEDYIGDYEYAYATFDGTQKRPALPTLPTNSTLTQSVQYITDVKNELLYQKNKLSTNLTSKGVVVLPTDKMSNLIDKVESIYIPHISIMPGDMITFFTVPTSGTDITSSTYVEVFRFDKNIPVKQGGIRCKTRILGSSAYNLGALKMEHIRNGNIITSKEYYQTSNDVDTILDITDYRIGDKVIVSARKGSSTNYIRIFHFYVKFDVQFL